MNIEFIKFLVKYAEGFDLREKKDGSVYIWYKDFSIITTTDYYKWFIYPLLLQRAIEGINLSKTEYSIDLINDLVEVCKGEYSLKVILPSAKGITYDKAKEQALKYVWEQEK